MDKHCSSAGAIPADGAVALWSCVTRRILNDAGFQTSNENVPKKRVEFFTNLMYDESKNGKEVYILSLIHISEPTRPY